MPVRTAIWKVGSKPQPLQEAALPSEQMLEEMIVAEPRLLSEEWMLVGRQVPTGFGGRIDLLAVAPDASLVLIELKRDQTPREVVAQALDYAYYVERLEAGEIATIYAKFRPGADLAQDFQARFGALLEEEALNQSHQIVIVAAALDASTERIVQYLSGRELPINVLFFQVFANSTDQFLSRTWLLDPVQVQAIPSGGQKDGNEPWNGEFYCSFGDPENRSWEDAVEFGFISGGGGAWYSRTLQLLGPGDRVWVKVPGAGFVGVGIVEGRVQPAKSFVVQTPVGEKPVLEVARRAAYHAEHADDLERCEYFVPVRWLQTVPVARAIQELGMFGNQNTVCQPTTPKWRTTVERLKERFPDHDRPS